MIAFLDGMPLVALPNGRNTTFDKRWVTDSLRQAAHEAGHHQWWLAEHIAESLSVYLKRDFDENLVPVINLQEAVLDVLQNLGFEDVAGHFQLSDPPVRLSLKELALEAGEGYELAFFGILGDHLQRVSRSRSLRLEIYDLPDCLRMLSGNRRRGHREVLREEIVDFVREYGHAAGTHRQEKALEIQLQ
jgi:hypothetical protein